MPVNSVEGIQGYIEMPVPNVPDEGQQFAVTRAEMPHVDAPRPSRSPMPISDTIEPDPILNIHTNQAYQQQQAYLNIVWRMEIGAVGLGGSDRGILPPPYDASLLRPAETLIDIARNSRNAVLPYNPYIYHNYLWKQPSERISIIW
ncbi:TPA: hypothetical protein DCX16_02940 [bacterium]|nr:hypothetical protein [bacterium]